MTKFLIAIVYTPGDPRGDFKKYVHNIKNTDHYKSKFCNDMVKKFSCAQYVNFYWKISGGFLERRYLKTTGKEYRNVFQD
jgi:hypothetical protein